MRCPRGQALEGLGKRTLGSRHRGVGSSVAAVRRFVEEEKAPEAPVDEATVGSHRLVLWTPPENDAAGRREVVLDYVVSCKLREHQCIGAPWWVEGQVRSNKGLDSRVMGLIRCNSSSTASWA